MRRMRAAATRGRSASSAPASSGASSFSPQRRAPPPGGVRRTCASATPSGPASRPTRTAWTPCWSSSGASSASASAAPRCPRSAGRRGLGARRRRRPRRGCARRAGSRCRAAPPSRTRSSPMTTPGAWARSGHGRCRSTPRARGLAHGASRGRGRRARPARSPAPGMAAIGTLAGNSHGARDLRGLLRYDVAGRLLCGRFQGFCSELVRGG
mmetsp:Transcript_22988/g.64578  ORF Transcript_22988/g.64578 Transcript_22988/m.64578 type:complete len:211 (+) Transcript_22988:480-1112(+)